MRKIYANDHWETNSNESAAAMTLPESHCMLPLHDVCGEEPIIFVPGQISSLVSPLKVPNHERVMRQWKRASHSESENGQNGENERTSRFRTKLDDILSKNEVISPVDSQVACNVMERFKQNPSDDDDTFKTLFHWDFFFRQLKATGYKELTPKCGRIVCTPQIS